MTTVGAVPGQTVGLDPSLLAGASGTASSPSGVLDKDAFLKLLVAQLKYQDPMNPTSNEQFVATTAQFTTIERLEQLATQGASAAQVSALATASALVGRQVQVLGDDGQLRSTTVLRGQFADGQLALHTELGPVGIDRIASVGPPPAATATPADPTTPTTPSTAGSPTP